MARAPRLGRGGRRFESSLPDHNYTDLWRIVIKFILYLVRWQLSTIVMTPVIATIKNSPSIWGTKEDWIAVIVANLVGGAIFFWVDRFIFKSKAIEKWEILKKGRCHDCDKIDLVRRLVLAPGGYDRTNDTNPEYRCKECSEKKLLQLKRKKAIHYN